MALSLDNFEQQIDETILERGLDYFSRGCVTDMEDLGGGDYEATVEGSDTYIVDLHIEGNKVTEYECDCPYDWGLVCKHTVAALYYLQEELSDADSRTMKEAQPRLNKESEGEQVKRLLNQLSHDDLKSFVHEKCASDKGFRKLFIANHISCLYPESKELYTKQLQTLVDTYSDRYGFVEYREAQLLGDAVSNMAEEALAGLEKGKKWKAIYVAEAIVEEISKVMNATDDSDGHIGGSIEEAFEVLEALAESDLDEAMHNELFNWLITRFEKSTLKGWDRYFGFIEVAIGLIKSEQEKERIETLLSRIKPTDEYWDWNYRKAQALTLRLIRKTENEEATVRFMESHLSNEEFRKELIEKALREKNYAKAEDLAAEGLRKDEKEARGLAEDWRNYLFVIYQKTNNTEEVIRLARHFLVNFSGRYQARDYYYDLLKSLIPREQWQEYVEGLVASMNNASTYDGGYRGISQLYIREAQWEKLLGLLRENVSFERIADAEQYLAGTYTTELATMYKDLILTYMEKNVGRSHYQSVCRYIGRMIKLGARPMAIELMEQLRKLYPNRRALLDELSGIKIDKRR